MPSFIDARSFGEQLYGGKSPTEGVRKTLPVGMKAINQEERTIDFVISTEAVDRDFDTISVAGWQLAHYRKNPVVLWAHDSRSLPIARALHTRKEDGALVSTAQFTPADMNPNGDTVFRMYVGKFLHAVSVGFMPITFDRADDEKRPFGVDFKKQDLLEFSAVPVPANPEALVQAAKSGIDIKPIIEWAEHVLDGEGKLFIPRAMVEECVSAAQGRRRSIVVPRSLQDQLLRANLARVRAQEDGEDLQDDDASAAPAATESEAAAAPERDEGEAIAAPAARASEDDAAGEVHLVEARAIDEGPAAVEAPDVAGQIEALKEMTESLVEQVQILRQEREAAQNLTPKSETRTLRVTRGPAPAPQAPAQQAKAERRVPAELMNRVSAMVGRAVRDEVRRLQGRLD